MRMPEPKADFKTGNNEEPKNRRTRKIVRDTANGRVIYEVKESLREQNRGYADCDGGDRAGSSADSGDADDAAVERRTTLRLLNSLAHIVEHSTFGGADRRRGVLTVAADLFANIARLQERPFEPQELCAWALKNVPGVTQSEIEAAAGEPVVPWRPGPAAVGAAIHLTWEEWVVLSPWGVWPEGASEADIKNARLSAKRERDRERMREKRRESGIVPRGEKDTIKSAAERYGVSRKTAHEWKRKGILVLTAEGYTKVARTNKEEGLRCDTSVTFERARRKPSARALEKEAPTKEVGARPGAWGAGRASTVVFTDAELSAMVAALEAGLSDSVSRTANVLRFRNPTAIARLCDRAANIMQPRGQRVAAGGQS